jgi:hypothetical protein
VSVPCFCCFCVSEKLHRKYSLNWTKQKPKFLFFPKRHGVQSRDRGVGGRTMPRRGPPPGHAGHWCGPGGPNSDATLPPIYSPRRENLRGPINFPRNILQAVAVTDARSGGSRSSFRHPIREGNHRRRLSSSPCLPPE